MGALLGQSSSHKTDTGLAGSRISKRFKRDQALNELYNMGMDRNIYLHHSDHWAVVRGYADWANQAGKVVIDTLNANVKRDPSRGERFIYSANSEQYSMLQNKITQAIREKEEAERKAREEAERKAKEESKPQAPDKTTDTDGNGGLPVPAVPKKSNELTTNPYLIGGAALGVGVVALLLLRG